MVSLAGYLRELAQKGIFDIAAIVQKYEAWVLEDRYMVMAHEREAWVCNAGKLEYIAVKCALAGGHASSRRHSPGTLSRLGSGGCQCCI